MTKAARLVAKRAAVRNQPEEDPEFQIAPMIDILLVLLVFFMSISSTEVLQTNDQVKLPIAKDASTKKPGTLRGSRGWRRSCTMSGCSSSSAVVAGS